MIVQHCLLALCVLFKEGINSVNPLTPNDDCSGHTAPLTSKRCILYIYSTNIGTEYFKHDIYCPFFPLQNAVCFINLIYLVPLLFTFYIQDVPKLKKNNSGAKRLIWCPFVLPHRHSAQILHLPALNTIKNLEHKIIGVTDARIRIAVSTASREVGPGKEQLWGYFLFSLIS